MDDTDERLILVITETDVVLIHLDEHYHAGHIDDGRAPFRLGHHHDVPFDGHGIPFV